jgi:predicted PurR-regulated permease PerM
MSNHLQPPAPDDHNPTPEQLPMKLAAPIDVRSTALAVLALIALIVFLHWAQAVLVPITFALLLSYALTPVVDWLKRNAKLHKAVGAALTLALILGGLVVGISTLQPKALDILDLVPRATQKFSTALRGDRTSPGAVSKIEKAASEIDKVANSAGSPSPATAVAPAKLLKDRVFGSVTIY